MHAVLSLFLSALLLAANFACANTQPSHIEERYDNGQKKLEVQYEDGAPCLLVTEWYENGKKLSEGHFLSEESTMQGLWIYWYENGQKAMQGQYNRGERQGLWIEWYENGQKRNEGKYEDGLKQDVWIFWYENGVKMKEGFLIKNRLQGLLTDWDSTGQKISETVYEDNKEVSKKTFD